MIKIEISGVDGMMLKNVQSAVAVPGEIAKNGTVDKNAYIFYKKSS